MLLGPLPTYPVKDVADYLRNTLWTNALRDLSSLFLSTGTIEVRIAIDDTYLQYLAAALSDHLQMLLQRQWHTQCCRTVYSIQKLCIYHFALWPCVVAIEQKE